MSIEELVKKLLEYIKAGQNVQAEEELYADDVISFEQNGYHTVGKQATIEKTKNAFAGIEESYGGGVTATFVGLDTFLLVFELDMKPKGGERMQMTEYGFYKVKGGKISEEYFFAQPLQ